MSPTHRTMSYLSQSDTESEEDVICDIDEDRYVDDVLTNPDSEEFRCDRKILECLRYVETLSDVDLVHENAPLGSDKIAADMIYVKNDILKSYLKDTDNFRSDKQLPSFAVVDFEGIDAGGMATCLEGTVLVNYFSTESMKYENGECYHFHFKTPGKLLIEPHFDCSPLAVSKEDHKKQAEKYSTSRLTLGFNISRIHGIPLSLGGMSVTDATDDYLDVWNRIEKLLSDNNCDIILTKGSTFDPKMFAWILHKARESCPTLPNVLPYTVVGSFDAYKSFYTEFLPRVCGRPVMPKPKATPLLPSFDKRVMTVKNIPILLGIGSDQEELKNKCDSYKQRLFSDMDDDGFFNRIIPHKYIQPEFAIKVARIHEIPCWYENGCEFHTKAEPFFISHFKSESDSEKPIHIHCSRRDTFSFSNAICCIVNACQTHRDTKQ